MLPLLLLVTSTSNNILEVRSPPKAAGPGVRCTQTSPEAEGPVFWALCGTEPDSKVLAVPVSWSRSMSWSQQIGLPVSWNQQGILSM